MYPITTEDLLPLSEYLARRREFHEAHRRYRDRYRRIRIGPQVSLLFENRQTLWFRLQEFLRLARLSEPEEIKHHLDWFNALLPQPQRLQAAFVVEVEDEADWQRQFDYWRDLRGEHVRLWLENIRVPAHLVTARQEDRTLGIAHWLEFPLSDGERLDFADPECPVRFEVDYKRYSCFSAHLNEEMRNSLLDDLDAAGRAAA